VEIIGRGGRQDESDERRNEEMCEKDTRKFKRRSFKVAEALRRDCRGR
jgi:hypothetical protein